MGLLLVLSITYCVNLFRNLGYSRLYTALRTEAGAHPPGLTTEQYVILVVRLSLEALSLVRSPSTTVSHTKQTVKPTLKQPPWFSGASGCLVDCKIKMISVFVSDKQFWKQLSYTQIVAMGSFTYNMTQFWGISDPLPPKPLCPRATLPPTV